MNEEVKAKISMGTGAEYALVERDLSFEEYIGNMAFQYGALLAYRDERHDGTLPDKESFYKQNYAGDNSFQKRQVLESTQERDRLLAMSEEEKTQYGLGVIQQNLDYAHTYLKEYTLGLERLNAMLEFVSTWQPESDYSNIRTHAIDNLERCIISQQSSIDWCLRDIKKNESSSALDVFNDHLASVLENITYYTNNDQENSTNVDKRWEWIEGLQASLRNHAQSIQKKQLS